MSGSAAARLTDPGFMPAVRIILCTELVTFMSGSAAARLTDTGFMLVTSPPFLRKATRRRWRVVHHFGDGDGLPE